MIKLIKFIIIVLLLGAIAFFGLAWFSSSQILSNDQVQIRETYGPPEQFMITYLPRGSADDPQLVRSEVWYYPGHGKQVNFLAGQVLSVDDFIAEQEIVASTSLRPEDFDIYMGFKKVAAILGELNIEALEVPVLFEVGEVETYTSDKAVFIIEEGYLTYFHTIGIGDEVFEENMDEENISLAPLDEAWQEKKLGDTIGQVLGEEEILDADIIKKVPDKIISTDLELEKTREANEEIPTTTEEIKTNSNNQASGIGTSFRIVE